MKKLQSYRDLEESLKNELLPQIDIRDNVIKHLDPRGRSFGFKRKTMIMFLVIVLTFSTALAAVGAVNDVWQILSRDGRVLYTYQELTKKDNIVKRHHSIDSSQYKGILNTGEAALVIVLSEYDYTSYFEQQPEKFYKFSEIENIISVNGEKIKIPEGFDFSSADIEYDVKYPDSYQIYKAVNEARANGEKIIKLDLERLSKFKTATLFFRNPTINIKEEIYNYPEAKLGYSSYEITEEKVEKIKVNDNEALYIQKDDIHKIILVKEVSENIKIKYTVYGSIKIQKDDLIKAAEGIN